MERQTQVFDGTEWVLKCIPPTFPDDSNGLASANKIQAW